MKNNIAGNSVETIFYVLCGLITIAIIYMNFHTMDKISSIEYDLQNEYKYILNEISEINIRIGRLNDKIDNLSHDLNRSTLDLRNNLEATKPIRANNWDSVREAFKGPQKVEKNERT